MTEIILKTTLADLLESFAKGKRAISFIAKPKRDELTIMFDGVHGQDFKISEVIDAARQRCKKSGFTLQISG